MGINNPKVNYTDTLLKLYQLYDDRINARLSFLEGFEAKDYYEYREKYSGASFERSHFIAVCGFLNYLAFL
jgi:hypothetical protein